MESTGDLTFTTNEANGNTQAVRDRRCRLTWAVGLLLSVLPLGGMMSTAIAQETSPQESSTPAAEVAPPTQRVSRPTLRLGSEGAAVSELQAMLKLMGYYDGVVDGIYEASTQSAVAEFQQAAELSADGIVGPATWNRLFPDPPATANPPATEPSTTADNSNPMAFPSTNASSPDDPAADPGTQTAGDPESPAANASQPGAMPAETSQPTSDNTTQSPAGSSNDANAPVDFPILRRGMHGPAIVRLQERLSTLDFYQGAVDGIFGPATEAAVQSAQRHFQLSPDGVVGPATWSALLR